VLAREVTSASRLTATRPTTLATSALPLCMGVAVLKYRPYELNRSISRVVSYTLITAVPTGKDTRLYWR
jgi:hypothetical protein